MGLRLQASGLKDLANNSWTVEIYDSDYVASTIDFEVKQGSLQLKYQGNTSKMPIGITPSTLSFIMMIEDGIHEAFISDLVLSPEDEFTVKLLKGSTLYWAGRLVVDQVTIKDQYFPYELKISAVDGLSVLKNVEYFDDGVPYEGVETLLAHIQNCLSKIGTDGLWGVTDDYLITGINWFEDSHSSPDDPFATTRVSHEVFYKTDEESGEKDHLSCYEVLEHICTTFAANIRLSEGAFYVSQIPEFANSTQRRVSYYTSGLQKAVNTSTSYDVEVDQTRTSDAGTGRWRTSGNFGYTAQLRKVKLIYDNTSPVNFIQGQTWNEATGGTIYVGNTIAAGTGVVLRLSGLFLFSMDVLTSQIVLHIHKFQFYIKVGSYYLKRTSTYNGFPAQVATYSTPEWTTTPSYYDWWGPVITPSEEFTTDGVENFYDITQSVSFTTPALVADGEVSFSVERVLTYDPVTDLTWNFSALNMAWSLVNAFLGPDGEDEYSEVDQALVYISNNPDTDNNTKTEKYNTIIGDGPNDAYPGHLEVYNGSMWESSGDWQVAAAGDALELGKLFVRELMGIQRKPREIYRGNIIGQAEPSGVNPPGAHERVEIQSGKFYYLTSGTLNIDEWRWNGTWVLVDRDITSVTIEDTIATTTDVPFIGAPISGQGNVHPVIFPVGGNTIFDTNTVTTNDFFSGYMSAGQVDTVALASIDILPGQINEGDTATITTPSGQVHSFIVAQDHQGGNAGIAAYTYIPFNVPSNSIISVSQPQTIGGEINTADTVQQVFEEDSTAITNPGYLGLTVGELYTHDNAGNGSTAGVVIDSEGVQAFDSSSSTPIAWLRSDDEFANFKALVFQQVIAELTKEAGLFYVYKGAFPVLADAIATRPIEPVSKRFQLVGYNVNVTTSVYTQFFVPGLKWSGYRFGRYQITCQSYGSGSGNNTLQIYKNGLLQISAGFTIPLWTNVSVPISMSLSDVFHFEVSSVRSTPPQGLVIEMEFIV